MSKKDIHSSFPTIQHVSTSYDECIGSRVLSFEIGVPDFIQLVAPAFVSQGLIDGQRDVVQTASAKRIRARMASDLQKGALLPAIVLGTTVPTDLLEKTDWTSHELASFFVGLSSSRLSIIDGMQRTAVFREHARSLTRRIVRAELWLAPSTDRLIYRMLILNTGQIPWTIRRQLEVVYRGFIEELRDSRTPGLHIYGVDDASRRTRAGEFQANEVIEMYLAFNLRKPHVDKESALADQFSRLDLIESVSKPGGMTGFLEALGLMASLDRQFSRATSTNTGAKGVPLGAGRHIFDKSTACAGFMAAYAQFVLGRVGMDRDENGARLHRGRAKRAVDSLVSRLSGYRLAAVRDFLALDTLREVLSARGGGQLSIGEREREVFTSAFRLLLDEGSGLASMEPCWRSQ